MEAKWVVFSFYHVARVKDERYSFPKYIIRVCLYICRIYISTKLFIILTQTKNHILFRELHKYNLKYKYNYVNHGIVKFTRC